MTALTDFIIEILAIDFEDGNSGIIAHAEEVISRLKADYLVKLSLREKLHKSNAQTIKIKLIDLLLNNLKRLLNKNPSLAVIPHDDGRLPMDIAIPSLDNFSRVGVRILYLLFDSNQHKKIIQKFIILSKSSEFKVPKDKDADENSELLLITKLIVVGLPFECFSEFGVNVIRQAWLKLYSEEPKQLNLLDAKLLIAGRSAEELNLRCVADESRIIRLASASDAESLHAMYILITKYEFKFPPDILRMLKISINTLLLNGLKSHENKAAQAFFIAGKIYREGLLGSVNLDMALKLYSRAVEMHHQQAIVALAIMYDNGEIGLLPNGEPDYSQAKTLYFKAITMFDDQVAKEKIQPLLSKMLQSPTKMNLSTRFFPY